MFSILHVNAESANFYEAEYVDNIYMVKYQYSTKTKYYQKARFFRRSGDNQAAYCLEPFTMFNGSEYYSTTTPRNLSQEQMNRIKKIIYFGYGYGSHWDSKWYAVTQLMIWQTAETNGDYYFTDTLNGNRVNILTSEINEINSLVEKDNIIPSFTDQDFYYVEGEEIEILDQNNILYNYKTSNENITINNTKLNINNLEKGDYEFTLSKERTNHNKPILFYQSNNSQNIVNVGDIENEQIKFRVHILNTSINITKIDKDTQSIIQSGEASLDGALYELTDEEGNFIDTLEIIDNVATIKNIPFGKYYLKEVLPGTGYTLDEKTYEIEITVDSPTKELILENKVIEKNIEIEKQFGENNTFSGEENVNFEIYDNTGSLIKTITTNNEGKAEITLPYGKYTVKQLNSKEGYEKLEPFNIEVKDSIKENIVLKDYKVPVPNTHTSVNIWQILFFKFLLLIC